MTFTIAVMTISCKWDWNKLVGTVYCLPGFQLVKHFQLLKELKNAMTEMDLVNDDVVLVRREHHFLSHNNDFSTCMLLIQVNR